MTEEQYAATVASADPTVIFDLFDELRLAWERILNTYAGQKGHDPVKYLDALMAVHNFHKVAIHHVVEESEMTPPEAALVWQSQRDTFTLAANVEIGKLKTKAFGEGGPS